eukprot:1010084-Prymnesium_polylepis.1
MRILVRVTASGRLSGRNRHACGQMGLGPSAKNHDGTVVRKTIATTEAPIRIERLSDAPDEGRCGRLDWK